MTAYRHHKVSQIYVKVVKAKLFVASYDFKDTRNSVIIILTRMMLNANFPGIRDLTNFM